MNNNYNNQNMDNNFNNAMNNNNGNQFIPNGMPQQNNVPNNNPGSFTGITPNMVNNQNPVNEMPVSNQSTFVNNEVPREEMNAIIAKNLPKLVKGNNAKTQAMIFLIIGGFFLLLGLVLYFVMEEDSKTLFLVLGIIMGVIFIPVGLLKLIKAGKLPIVDYNLVQQELYAPDCVLFKEPEVFFTKSFIVKYGSGKFVFPYQEIAMAYTQEHPQATATVNTGGLAGALISGAIAGAQAAAQMAAGTQDVALKTKSGVTQVFFARKREEEILATLQVHNPSILIGNTKENREAYKAMKNSSQPVNQPMQQPMNNNMPQQNMGQPNPQGFGPQPMPNQNVNPGMQRPMNNGPMPQGMNNNQPNNGLYQRPADGQPKSYSSNINDQQIFNRF